MFDFRVVTQWVDATLHQYLPASLVTTTEFVLVGVCLLVAYAVMALGLIYAERKVCAFFQCRLGPNRVGPFGMIQTQGDHRDQSCRPFSVQPGSLHCHHSLFIGF